MNRKDQPTPKTLTDDAGRLRQIEGKLRLVVGRCTTAARRALASLVAVVAQADL